jgi:AcrR family transcriptional regulator
MKTAKTTSHGKPRAAPMVADNVPARGPATKALILDTAETLFAQRGIQAVSLREIALAASQRNNSAVRYHFGDKEGLIDALLTDRLAKIESKRKLLVERAGDLAGYSAVELLAMFWQPLLDLKAPNGAHYFVQFGLSHQVQMGAARHPLAVDASRHEASWKILLALKEHFGHLSLQQFYYRLARLGLLFWGAVASHDHAALVANETWSSNFSMDETLKLVAAALSAPA